MKIAVEGCSHGQLNQIYKLAVSHHAELLIICGDFQSARNNADLNCINMPKKYRRMGDFQSYYTGKQKAPIFTIFIGGNHEASNYLEELKYGGFVAPNIYYLGRSGVVWYKGLRILGWSGIYKSHDFMKLREDIPIPYDYGSIKRVYHYRKDDYMKLRMLKECNSSLVVSHDWPSGIWNNGNVKSLLKKKPFFKSDIEHNALGSPFNAALLEHLKPMYWFSAHLHVHFMAVVDWKEKRRYSQSATKCKHPKLENDDEINLNLDDIMNNEITEPHDEPTIKIPTNFVSLDKCLGNRKYIDFFNIAPTDSKHISTYNEDKPLYFDSEYISIMKAVQNNRKLLDQMTFEQVLSPPDDYQDLIQSEASKTLAHYKDLSLNEYTELFNIDMHGFVKTANESETKIIPYPNKQTMDFISKFY